MSGAPAKRAATYQDLLKVPEHVVGEIIDGELVTSPRPTARHASASSTLGVELGAAFGRSGRGGPGRKMHHYARALVPHVWLVDPGPQTLEVFRLYGNTWRWDVSVAGGEPVRAEPFDAIELDLGSVWAI